MQNRKKIRIEDPIERPHEALLAKYSNENICLDSFFISRAIKETNGCFSCGGDILKHYKKINGRKGYQCSKCLFQVYPMAGTVIDHSHVKLKDFFEITIDKILNHSGITANKIAYKFSFGDGTAWSILLRSRQWMALANSFITFENGPKEIDESGINTGTKGLGRKKKRRRGFGSDSITPCFTLVERDGNVKSFIIPDREADTILPIILDNVEPNTKIYTDEYKGYSKLKSLGFDHKTVNHSRKEWKNGDACTNRAEGYFGLVKPNLKGTYRQISEKYAQLYMEEHDFRYNNRHVPLDQRFQKLLDALPPLFEHVRERESNGKDVA